jgi:hypothetical protein
MNRDQLVEEAKFIWRKKTNTTYQMMDKLSDNPDLAVWINVYVTCMSNINNQIFEIETDQTAIDAQYRKIELFMDLLDKNQIDL